MLIFLIYIYIFNNDLIKKWGNWKIDFWEWKWEILIIRILIVIRCFLIWKFLIF